MLARPPAGPHAWTDDDIGDMAAWGITAFGDLRASTRPPPEWLAGTCGGSSTACPARLSAPYPFAETRAYELQLSWRVPS